MAREVRNPPNPYASAHVEYLEAPPHATLTVYEERARRVLAENSSPDVPFRWSVNPYRGCVHACAYCYARPTHQYLDFGAGTDFDRKIVAKVNAPDVLRREFDAPKWDGELVVFSGNTDCYQPHEASYALTRRCLEVCAEYRNPAGVITKSPLVLRDTDVLERLAQDASVVVYFSIAFADDETARLVEPHAPPPSKRYRAMRALADRGIRTAVSLAPVIPGLNESDAPTILERAREAGATSAFMTLVRMPREVLPVFDERMREAFPLRAERIRNGLESMHGGRAYDPRFERRMRGEGPKWKAIEQMFEMHARRLGYVAGETYAPAFGTFKRPTKQGSLFE